MVYKIIIVEDEPLIAEDLATILAKEGHQIVGICYNGTEALDMIHNRQPHLVLLDISLDASMSGLEVAQKLNASSKTPFIFITSFSDKQTLDEAKELFPAGYIVKPFKNKDIITTVELVLFKNSQQKELNEFVIVSFEELNRHLSEDSHITNKEYEVSLDVLQGLSNQDIADKHYISLNTVKTHFRHIFQKLDISSRSQLVGILMRQN